MLKPEDIQTLCTQIEWGGGDVRELEDMLSRAGKGGKGDYEHFLITMALHGLEECLKYLTQVVRSYDVRTDDIVQDSPTLKSGNIVVPEKDTKDEERLQKEAERLETLMNLVDEVIGDLPDTVLDAQCEVPGSLGKLVGEVCKRAKATNESATVLDMFMEKLCNSDVTT